MEAVVAALEAAGPWKETLAPVTSSVIAVELRATPSVVVAHYTKVRPLLLGLGWPFSGKKGR